MEMSETPIQVKFKNKVNPQSAFDLVKLEELLHREILDHSTEAPHRVEFFILLLVTEGQGKHTIDFTDYSYEKGTILTIRKDQIHRFHKVHQPKGHLLLFTDEFLVSYLEELEAKKALQLFNEMLVVPKIQLLGEDVEHVFDIISRIEHEYLNQADDYALGIIRSELHILITKLFRIKAKSHKTLLGKKYLTEFIAFQKLVEEHVTRTSRVADYAEMMATSTKTLNTISKSILNKTAKEFIDEIGATQIKRLLINTSLSVKEVAYASGFDETTNFYKYFKRQVGVTPEKFRSSS